MEMLNKKHIFFEKEILSITSKFTTFKVKIKFNQIKYSDLSRDKNLLTKPKKIIIF